MTIVTGLIIAIKDNGFLALISIAAPIYVSDIRMCRKVPLHTKTHLLCRSITPGHFWSLITSGLRMFINAGVNIKM